MFTRILEKLNSGTNLDSSNNSHFDQPPPHQKPLLTYTTMHFSTAPTMNAPQQGYTTLTLPLRPAPATTNRAPTTGNVPINQHQAKGNAPASLTTYTYVCGIIRPATGEVPEKMARPIKGKSFCCPQCDTEFTRPNSVQRHFPVCVRKYGNPLGISWDDHESCVGKCRNEDDDWSVNWSRPYASAQRKDMAHMAAREQTPNSMYIEFPKSCVWSVAYPS